MNDDASNARIRIDDLLAHAGWVRALAASLVSDAATADDVVQETWLAALQHPPRGDRPVRPWLAQVARNVARQWRRGERRRDAREQDATSEPRDVPPTDALVERIELQRLLAGLVVALDEPYRTTVILRFDEGLDAAEIARRLGIPAGTVRWRLKVGLDRLRDALDERHGGDRRAWCALLLPLALREPARAGAALALGKGAFAVGTFAKMLAALVAAVVIVLVCFVSGVVPRLLSPFGRAAERPAEVTFRPMASPPAHGETSAAAPVSAVASSAAPPRPAAIDRSAPAPAIAHVELRVVDEAGLAIRGALVHAEPEPATASATSGDDGRVAFDLAPPIDPWDATFRASRIGRTTVVVGAPLRGGATAWLGDVVLAPGGAVSGRVVGDSGAGIAGARVFLGELDAPKEALEERRRVADAGYENGPFAITHDDGAFVLDGAGVGFVRLWAAADGFTSGYSPPVEVREASESAGVVISLEKTSGSAFVEGRVVAPDGSSIAHAQIAYRFGSAGGGSGSGSTSANADGHFRLRLTMLAPHDLVASDPSGVYASASVREVAPGTRDLVIRLTEPRTIELDVRDREGVPVERWSVATLDPEHETLFHAEPAAARENGRGPATIPPERFVVEIDADGFELATLGPFDPASAPERLACTLERVPGVRGIVRAHGAPQAGARVAIHAAASERIEHDGFPVRVKPEPAAVATTDALGRFALTLREDGRFYVRAEAEGLAPGEIGPLAIDHHTGLADLAFDLDAGGAIEGVVTASPPRRPEGTIIGISRGDAHAVTQRVGPDGRFRFERLTPGRWRVEPRDGEIVDSRSETRTSSGSAAEPPTNCVVERGRTTRFDVDLDAERSARRRVRGTISIDGRAPVGWTASCFPTVRLFSDPAVEDVIESSPASSAVNPRGEFAIEGATTDAFRLMLVGPAESSNGLRILDLVEASPADADWRLDLRTATLEGEAPASSASSTPAFVHVWTRGESLLCLTPIRPDAAGRFSIAGVPAGPGRIVRFDPGLAVDDPHAWPSIAEVDVPAGGIAHVTLR